MVDICTDEYTAKELIFSAWTHSPFLASDRMENENLSCPCIVCGTDTADVGRTY